MTHTKRPSTRERVSAHRERLRAAGRIYVNTDLPADLVAQLDRIKEERGASSRAPIIEEAVRLLIEKKQRA
jgi:metal-responsive CopG/Arc/MetJ family transcriptional regulator